MPKTYREAIELLLQNEIVPRDLGDSLRGMVRLRSRAVHLYDEIAADEVRDILETRLDEFESFVAGLVSRYFADRPCPTQ